MDCPRCTLGKIADTDDLCHQCGFTLARGKAMSRVVSAEMERSIRRAFRPQFRIEGLLGRGGMSLVYLAHEVELNRFVAMKVLPLQLALDGNAAERFKREAKIAASLDHAHIVPIHQIGSRSTFLWFTMKFVRGRSLVELLGEGGPLGVVECLGIVEQVAAALQYAHDRGVVHRDVKPANVMVDESGWVLVCDFGIAKAFGSVPLTQTGGALGTPSYMSPEQFYGRRLDDKSDQYSLAILAYEMLAGEPPFTGSSFGEILRKQCTEPAPRLTDVRPEIASEVSSAVDRALSKKPSERFENVVEFVAAMGGRRPGLTTLENVKLPAERSGRVPTQRLERRARGPLGHLPVIAAGVVLLIAVAVAMPSRSTVESRPNSVALLAEAAIRDVNASADGDLSVRGGSVPPAAGDSVSEPQAGGSAGRPGVRSGDGELVEHRLDAGPDSLRALALSADRTSAAVTASPPPRKATAPAPRRRATRAPAKPDARVAIEQVVARLARAIESRDVSQLRRVHPTLSNQDQESWSRFFGSVQTLKVQLTVTQLNVRGDTATVRLDGTYEYQRNNGRDGNLAQALVLSLVHSAGVWGLTSIQNQTSEQGD